MRDIGIKSVALHAGSVVFDDAVTVSDLHHPLMLMPIEGDVLTRSKMELVVELALQGWEYAYDAEHFAPSSKKVFSLTMVARSRLYFACLMKADDVWARGGTLIRTHMPENYYKCLLQLDSLAFVASIETDEITRWSNRHWNALLSGAEVPPLLQPGMQALADGDDPEPDMQLEEQRPEAVVEDIPCDAVVQVDEGMLISEIDMQERAVGDFVIRYVDQSNAKGVARCYIKCLSHKRCAKWRQTNVDADPRYRHAFLHAWAKMGPHVTRAEQVHPRSAPSREEVEALMPEVPD